MPLQRPLPSSQFLQVRDPHKPISKSEIIVGFLQNLALPSVFHRELTEQDFELWDKLLAPYSVPAIEYAFDQWGRTGAKFPQPKDILSLVDAYCNTNSSSFERVLPSGRKQLDNYWPVYYWMFAKICSRVDEMGVDYVPLSESEALQLERDARKYVESRRVR